MTRIEEGVGDLVWRIEVDQAQVRYLVAERSGVEWHHVRSTSYTWSRREAQVFRFSLKIGGYSLSVVWPQNYCDGFLVWATKPRLIVWWFGPQNHRDSFLVWASKPSGRRFIDLRLKTDKRMKTVWGHVSTSDSLLRQEARRARVFQFLPQNWWRSNDGWCMWHHHRGRVKMKWKTIGLMASGAAQWKSNQTTLH
jgi:hypothetical protein